MRTADEVKKQISAIRDRLKELSGFYLGEGAAMTYVLEWVLEKRETSPAGELGRAGGDSEKIAANLTKAVEQAVASKPHDSARSKAAARAAKGTRSKTSQKK
jgi:hypothetical protein